MQPNKIALIQKAFPAFLCIPSEEWVSSGSQIIKVSPQPIIGEGHFFEHATFILKGCVRVYKVSPQGKELTLYRIRSGETCVIMLVSILGNTGYEAFAETEEESEFVVIPVPVFKRWLDNYKEVNQFIYRLILKRIVSVSELVEDMTFQPMNHRVAHLLLRKTSSNINVPLYVTHESLAMELGTAREVVSRMLKRFEKLGYIQLGRGKIHIVNRHNLEQIMEVK